MMPKRGPKSMTNLWNFGTCDFLFFVKNITFKSFFYMIGGTRNPSNIHKKNDANSMLENVMPKTWKVYKNGAEMGAKIHEIPFQNDVGFLIRKRLHAHPPRSRPADGRGNNAPPPYYDCLSNINKPE